MSPAEDTARPEPPASVAPLELSPGAPLMMMPSAAAMGVEKLMFGRVSASLPEYNVGDACVGIPERSAHDDVVDAVAVKVARRGYAVTSPPAMSELLLAPTNSEPVAAGQVRGG